MRDLTGARFGRLLVKEKSGSDAAGSRWHVICDCGVEKDVQRSALVSGAQVSCGCWKKERATQGNPRHGHSVGRKVTRTYGIWSGMRKRCRDTDNEKYGGRGIEVCERWDAFENFLKDMGEAPDGMSIERIENNGNYEPENCRWATTPEQARNKRNNIYLEFDGRKMILTDWANLLKIDRRTLAFRLKNGWTVEKTLTTPIGN